MQAVKNGIKTTLRTPGKALLFTLILAVLAVLLSTAFSVFSAVRGYLRDADGYFHTIANLEFIGGDYPDQTVFDPAAAQAVRENEAELTALKNSPMVLDFESASPALGVIEGMRRYDNRVFDPTAAVLLVNVYTYDPMQNQYTAFVSNTLYSQYDYNNTLIYLITEGTPLEGVEFEKGSQNGNRYLLCGNFTSGNSPSPVFRPSSVSMKLDGEQITLPDYELVHGDQVPENSVFWRYAELLKLQNNACRVSYTSNIEDCFPFHQQLLTLKEGRLFTEREQQNAEKVCVVVQSVASRLEKGIGDKINMSVLVSDTSVFDSDTLYERDSGEYEIVGIVHDGDDYPYWLFLPGKNEGGFKASTGYTVGQFRLKNDGAAEFLKQAEGLTGKGFRVTVYDQGYSSATEPMRELLFISVIFLAVCLLLAVVALVLQSHIFVSRQRDASRTMHFMGASKIHILTYFLTSALLLALIGGAIGIFVSTRIEGRVFEVMRRFATQFAEQDARYSSSRLSLIRTLDFDPKTDIRAYIAAGAALLAGAALSTVAFALASLKAENGASARKRAKKQAASEKTSAKTYRGKTSRLSGTFKYALLSIVRSPARTLGILLLCAAAALFFSRLTHSLKGYEAQLENYRSGAVISGFLTDLRGRWMDGLVIKEQPVLELVKTGEFKDISLTKRLGGCRIVGVAIKADGTEQQLEYRWPTSEYQYESRIYNVNRTYKWVSASQIEACPMFKYSKAKSITWLEGFDKSDFWFPNPVCALPESVMQQQGIELGDVILLECAYDLFDYTQLGITLVKVAASYSSTVSSAEVIVPLTKVAITDDMSSPDYYKQVCAAFEETYKPRLAETVDERIKNELEDGVTAPPGMEEFIGMFRSVSYSSCLFTLKSAEKLDGARQALADSGFNYVGQRERTRNYAVIEDEMYLNTTRSMQRQIQYVSTLYYALYAIAGVIGFALAWLLTVSRRKEIALMRALGTPNLRTVLNFFFEHALLCLAGLLIGLILTYFAFGMPLSFCLTLCAAFFALWCLSTLICLLFGLTKKTQAALVEIE